MQFKVFEWQRRRVRVIAQAFLEFSGNENPASKFDRIADNEKIRQNSEWFSVANGVELIFC